MHFLMYKYLLFIVTAAVGAFVHPKFDNSRSCFAKSNAKDRQAIDHGGLIRTSNTGSFPRTPSSGLRVSVVHSKKLPLQTKQEDYLCKDRLPNIQEHHQVTAFAKAHQQQRYVRWSTESGSQQDKENIVNTIQLQTAITTWTKAGDEDSKRIFLHAQVHVGSREYYDYYRTNPMFDCSRTAVLYELLVDETLLTYDDDHIDTNSCLGRVIHTVQASEKDQALAQQYGWVCQANSIDYARRNWYHADFTRQEYYTQLQRRNAPNDNSHPVVEAATALLVGPPLSSNIGTSRRRIFTNLFLPGNSFALFLRSILWLAVPSPELSILLLDWSSMWQEERISSASKGKISPIAKSVLQSIAYGRWTMVRQLVFGQVLIAGHKAVGLSPTNPETACMGERNIRALEAVDKAFRGSDQVHLLFGCNHCPDLHEKLQAKGYTCQGVDWRTVWTAFVGDEATNDDTQWKAVVAIGVLGYLGIDGADWINTLHDIFTSQDAATGSFAVLLYLGRHLGLYLGMSKFLLDMDEMASKNSNAS